MAIVPWLAAHWVDVMIHLGLDTAGGLTMKCCLGMCNHKHHQIIVFMIASMILSTTTVAIIG